VNGPPDIGDEYRLQLSLDGLSGLCKRASLRKPTDIRHVLVDRPLPFAAGGGDAAAARSGFHRLNTGVAGSSYPQRQTRLVQQAIRRIKIGRDLAMLFCVGGSKRRAQFKRGSAARRELELQLDLLRIERFVLSSFHFASCFRIASNSRQRFGLVLG
jgi:hypothetical protein